MNTLTRIIVACLATTCALLFSAVSVAQDDNTVAAGETFRAAAAAYERGDYEAAARSFEVSHRLAPHPNAIYNAGRAWQAAGKTARAADALTEAVAMDGISDDQRADAEARLAELQPKLAIAHVVGPAGTHFTLAHAEGRTTPATVHLTPGAYVISAKLADGRSVDKPIEARTAGGEVDIDLTPSGSPVPSPTPPPTPKPIEAPPNEPATVRNDAQWIAGWVLAGAGVVSGGVAIALGVVALQERDAFVASGNTDRDAHDRAATMRTTTNVMWVAAGAFAVTGALLLVFADSDAPSSSTGVAISPGLGTVVISGRW